MKLYVLIRSSFAALRANKGRSLLTVLGIVIGIAAIMLIVSLGGGAQQLILSELGGFGADLVVIRPGQEPTGPSNLAQTLFSNSLKDRDIKALEQKQNVPDLAAIAPAVVVPGSVSAGSQTYSRGEILGWSAQFMGEVFNVYPAEGEYFTETDIRNKASVAVIGDAVAKELFGQSDALGKNIRIGGHNFRVVGVLQQKGQVSFFNVDEVTLIPYSSAQAYLLGTDYYNEVMVKADSPDAVPRVEADITATLREMHHITDPSKDDFYVVTGQGLIAQVQTILSALTAFLSAVVAISLVVGGIGVMNIMLVSVTERTREIGLRKAIGATDADIMRQFLLESLILTIAGGIIGIILGLVLALLATLVLTAALGFAWSFVFSWTGAALGVGVSAAVGIVFGIYPARHAARLDPIEALRYE